MNFRWVNQGHGLKSFKLLLDRHPINLYILYFLGKLIFWTSSHGETIWRFQHFTYWFWPFFLKKGVNYSRGDIIQGKILIKEIRTWNLSFFPNLICTQLIWISNTTMISRQYFFEIIKGKFDSKRFFLQSQKKMASIS